MHEREYKEEKNQALESCGLDVQSPHPPIFFLFRGFISLLPLTYIHSSTPFSIFHY